MNSIKNGLPSVFTSLGLISGCISIVISISYGDLSLAGYFILIAAVFDFLDGMVARVLNSISAFGKQLDSLADIVSFGVAPAMILYQLLLLSYVRSSPDADFDVTNPATLESIVLFSAFLVAVFSALRLAKFNIDPDQEKNFKGLPTPANAIFIAALGFMAEASRELPATNIIFNRYFLLVVIILSCYFLVSNINMFSLKFSSFGIRKNFMRYIFLLFAIGLILGFGIRQEESFSLSGLAPVIVLYVVMSLINNWFVKIE
jgi:CDP-diacylglycerol--serine O-phosphatidyltransferase